MTHPHDPYVDPEHYWNRYRDEDIDMPRASLISPAVRIRTRSRLRHVIGLELVEPTALQVRAARRAYYGAVSYVDDQIGTLMSTLREARLGDEYRRLVLADHGDMLGERGLWYKMSFFEPACRIPLIVHAPGRFAPARIAEPRIAARCAADAGRDRAAAAHAAPWPRRWMVTVSCLRSRANRAASRAR